MKRTSPSWRSVRSAARSPARTRTGPGGHPEPDPHLGGHDAGQRGLAQPGRPGEQAGGRRAGRRLRAASMTMRRCSVSWPGRRTRRGSGGGAPPRRAPRPAPPPGRRGAVGSSIGPASTVGAGQTSGGPRGSPAAGQLAQGERTSSSTGASSSDAVERPRDLVGAVAELDQGRAGLTPGRAAPLRADGSAPSRDGQVEPGLQLEEQAGRRLLARPRAPGTGWRRRPPARRSTVLPAKAPTGWPAPASGPTPWAPSSASKHRRSSAWAKP